MSDLTVDAGEATPSPLMMEVLKSCIEVRYWAHDKATREDLIDELKRYHMPEEQIDTAIRLMVDEGLISEVVLGDKTYYVPGDELQREMVGYLNQSMIPFVPVGAESDYVYDEDTKTYRDLYDDGDWSDLNL